MLPEKFLIFSRPMQDNYVAKKFSFFCIVASFIFRTGIKVSNSSRHWKNSKLSPKIKSVELKQKLKIKDISNFELRKKKRSEIFSKKGLACLCDPFLQNWAEGVALNRYNIHFRFNPQIKFEWFISGYICRFVHIIAGQWCNYRGW